MRNKIRHLLPFLKDERGAVMMEYVIVGVLIAAACVMAVVIFSRAIFFGFDTAQLGAAGDASNVSGAQKSYREQTDSGKKTAEEYHDAMHTGDMK